MLYGASPLTLSDAALLVAARATQLPDGYKVRGLGSVWSRWRSYLAAGTPVLFMVHPPALFVTLLS